MNTYSYNHDPELYDLIHRGNPGDLEFYLSGCADGSSVLELGCGSGRIGLELARRGKRYCGLDMNLRMLESFRVSASTLSSTERLRLSLVEGDMSSFDLGERFDRVIIPYNGLLCLLDDRSVISCFSSIARHLEKDGLLLFDIYHVDDCDGDTVDDDTDEYELLVSTATDVGEVDVFERHLPSANPRRFDVSYLYRITSAGEIREKEQVIEQRCIYPKDISSLLAKAGMRVVHMLSDFTREPVGEETDQVVVVAGC